MLEIGLFQRELSFNLEIPLAVSRQASRLTQDYSRVTEILILVNRDHEQKGLRSKWSNVRQGLLVGERRLQVQALKAVRYPDLLSSRGSLAVQSRTIADPLFE